MMSASISITSVAVTSINEQASLSSEELRKPRSHRLGCLSRSYPSKNVNPGIRLQRSHSFSDIDVYRRSELQRSSSYNSLCYNSNYVQASTTQQKPKQNAAEGIFQFHFPSSLIPYNFHSFLFDRFTKNDIDVEGNTGEGEPKHGEMDTKEELKRGNWVERIMELQSQWRQKQQKEGGHGTEVGNEDFDEYGAEDGCEVHYSDDGSHDGDVMDGATFSKLLSPASWSDAKRFSKLAFLSNMAYVVPEIKANDLRRYYGLDLVTSSLAKKTKAIRDKLTETRGTIRSRAGEMEHSGQSHLPQPSVAYEIAASAASYFQSCTKDLRSSPSESPLQINDVNLQGRAKQLDREEETPLRIYNSEMAAYVATSTMTAIVAANEEQKQEAARDLQSLHKSPCEWFVCDDQSTNTRYFIIQGSDSLASWQANLLFEPSNFEETDALVHRGIYEAAKGIYEQLLQEVSQHLQRFGNRAKLQFAGHSLGGSLSLLVNLMLLRRKVADPSALLPVVTFGSPFVFCGGRKVLNKLGLDESQVHCVIMHRDIIPRTFSCNYPNHVVQVLQRLNGTFRSNPCLNLHAEKMLYSPLGKIFILQPNENSSPRHPFLPPGCGLYALEQMHNATTATALKAFLNNPHPLETLSDLTAYGSEGTILRDHDSNNYLKVVNEVIRLHSRQVRIVREHNNQLWPLLTSQSPHVWSHDRNLKRIIGV